MAAPINTLRGVILEGTAITAYSAEVLIGLGWLALAFALASAGHRTRRLAGHCYASTAKERPIVLLEQW